MPYERAKVYFDGSHYIAIPNSSGRRLKRVKSKNTTDGLQREFEKIYAENIYAKRQERKEKCVTGMLSYMDKEKATEFVDRQFRRKQRNLIERRKRMVRKANLHRFNYFCTFTYDSSKLTEDRFKTKLKNCLKNLCHRYGWQYMGVWERSSKGRLHFHGLFCIKQMVGELVTARDYSTTSHRMQETTQNTYFCKRFGRNDFHPITDNQQEKNGCIRYLLKYLEKSEERIVYSKGMNMYFISDITDEDVLCTIGAEDRKLLLADDFTCWKEWEYIGKVSDEVIQQMPKSNR